MNASAANPHLISFGLNGRVCLVTGGAQGIGEACCRRFAREGALVVIADMDDELAREILCWFAFEHDTPFLAGARSRTLAAASRH